MKTLKSKRFWLNVTTTVTMLAAVLSGYNLTPKQSEILTITVALCNIVMQVFFNQDKKTTNGRR